MILRHLTIPTLLTCVLAPRAYAQAPPTPPLILHIPSSARTAALGNAWVAGRDAEVVDQRRQHKIANAGDFTWCLCACRAGVQRGERDEKYPASDHSITTKNGESMRINGKRINGVRFD